jgi:hypothetical protein
VDCLRGRCSAAHGIRGPAHRRRSGGHDNEHNGALIDFVNQIRTRLLVTEVMVGLNKLGLPGFDIARAKDFTRHVLEAIRAGKLGYAILTAAKGR